MNVVTRTAVPRATVFLLALAILPWIAASPVGGWRSPSTTSVPWASAAIDSLTTPMVVTPDRPKVWPDSKRTDGPRGFLAIPPDGSSIDPSRSFTDDVLRPASIGSADVLAIDLAGRGPPLLLP